LLPANFLRLPLQLISVVELSTDGGGGGAYGGGTVIKSFDGILKPDLAFKNY
jgi:hypothetical protein